MNPVNQQKVFRQTLDTPLLLWSKRKLWTVRIIILVVIGSWVVLWSYLHHQVKQSKARLEQARIEQARKREATRRGAQYQQQLQQRSQALQTRSPFGAE